LTPLSRRKPVSSAVNTVLPTPVSVPVMKSVCFIQEHQSGNIIDALSKPLTQSPPFSYLARLFKR
jgi:hypothetical protein